MAAGSSTTDAEDYALKVYYLQSLLGAAGIKYIQALNLGKYCEKRKQELIDASWGMRILDGYDTADIALGEATNNKFTIEEMECLMDIVYLKLL